jgi:hypothetical protein
MKRNSTNNANAGNNRKLGVSRFATMLYVSLAVLVGGSGLSLLNAFNYLA